MTARRACRHGPSIEPALSAGGVKRWRCSGCARLFTWSAAATWYGMLECPGCETSVVLEVRCGACPAAPSAGVRAPVLRSGLKTPPPERVGAAPSAAVRLARLAALVGGRVYRWRHEDDLQAGLEVVLRDWPGQVLREAQLPGVRGRIDFVVDEDLGLEVKVDGGLSLVTRQVHRYLEVEDLAGVLLVTTVAGHLAVPREMLGKPVAVVRLIGGIS